MKVRIAIIGAGISGLTLARNLRNFADIFVFEKARGVGGRMSTRYADPFYFDHGAHTFTARTKLFQYFLKPYIENGTIAEWKGEMINLEIGKKAEKFLCVEPHFVASPNMNSLCKKMSEGINIHFSNEVFPLAMKQPNGWNLFTSEHISLGTFDWVISTAPPEQTLSLFGEHMIPKSSLHSSKMHACYSLMIGINKPWDKEWIVGKVHKNPIQSILINSTKPGRNKAVTAIVAHSCKFWADTHIDQDIGKVQEFLLAQFEKVSRIDYSSADYISTHRWKYAVVNETQKPGVFLDVTKKLAATSDWCGNSQIEEVWFNASKLSDLIAHKINQTYNLCAEN
jgi:renalase